MSLFRRTHQGSQVIPSYQTYPIWIIWIIVEVHFLEFRQRHCNHNNKWALIEGKRLRRPVGIINIVGLVKARNHLWQRNSSSSSNIIIIIRNPDKTRLCGDIVYRAYHRDSYRRYRKIILLPFLCHNCQTRPASSYQFWTPCTTPRSITVCSHRRFRPRPPQLLPPRRRFYRRNLTHITRNYLLPRNQDWRGWRGSRRINSRPLQRLNRQWDLNI